MTIRLAACIASLYARYFFRLCFSGAFHKTNQIRRKKVIIIKDYGTIMKQIILAAAIGSSLTMASCSNTQSEAGNGHDLSKLSLHVNADQLSPRSGAPQKGESIGDNSKAVPLWLFSAEKPESLGGSVQLPADCRAVQIKIVVTAVKNPDNASGEAVFRVHLSQGLEKQAVKEFHGVPVRIQVPAKEGASGMLELESYYITDPAMPLRFRIERMTNDPADKFPHPFGLGEVLITPVEMPAKPFVVQDVPGYNSWPMIQALGDKLVCTYSRGSAHSIGEGSRGVYARSSSDGGKSWSPETLIANDPNAGEVTIGKGLDENGKMLLWVRSWQNSHLYHKLYRSEDGVSFTLISNPKLNPEPMQITDVFSMPGVGLMALWFAGTYRDDNKSFWGTLSSSDNGITWKQNIIESGLAKGEWPTEPSAIYLGNGRIFAIARTEIGGATTNNAQFQMESTDYGKTWTRRRTNIGDVASSTPSLIFDKETGLLSNYYYQRGRGLLKRRVVSIDSILNNPLGWPDPELIAIGSTAFCEAGNVNATAIGNTHFLGYYTGVMPDISVVVSTAPAPSAK